MSALVWAIKTAAYAENNMDELKQFIPYFENLTWPLASVFLAYFLYKSGILGALTSWVQRQPNNKRIDNLEGFREEVEENHLHELEKLLVTVEKLEENISNIRERLASVETKLDI